MADQQPERANRGQRAGVPGAVLVGVGVLAFITCVTGFSLGMVSLGTWAGIAALLSSAAGLAWLTDAGRRQRGRRPLIPPGPQTAGGK